MSTYLICTAAVLFGLSVPAQQEDAGFTFPAKLAWTFKAEERVASEYRTAIFSSPVVDSTKVYFAGSNGVLYALYKKTGELAWSFSVGGMFDLSIHQLDEERMAIASETSVYCLNSENGIVNWIADSAGEITAGLAGNDTAVFYGNANGDVVCLDGTSGSERWRYSFTGEEEKTVRSSLLIDGGFLYCGNDSGSVVSLSLETGSREWGFEAGGRVRSGMIAGEGLLYFGSEDNFVYALKLDSGSLKWKQRTTGDVSGHPVVDENYLYISARDRSLRIYKLGSGRPPRQSPINLAFNFSVKPLLVGERLLFPQARSLMARSIEQNFIMAGTYVSPADITSSAVYDADSRLIFFGCRNGVFIAVAPADVELGEPAVADTPEVEISRRSVPIVQDPADSTGDETTRTVSEPGESRASDSAPSPEGTAEHDSAGREPEDEEYIPPEVEDLTPETALHTAQLLMKRGELERTGEMWQLALREKAGELFTVNLGLYCQEQSIRSLLEILTNEEAMILPSMRGGKVCYFVCIGMYPERDMAVANNARLAEQFPDLPEGKIYRMDSFFP